MPKYITTYLEKISKGKSLLRTNWFILRSLINVQSYMDSQGCTKMGSCYHQSSVLSTRLAFVKSFLEKIRRSFITKNVFLMKEWISTHLICAKAQFVKCLHTELSFGLTSSVNLILYSFLCKSLRRISIQVVQSDSQITYMTSWLKLPD